MNYVRYDCELENEALPIAIYNCNHTSEPDFDYVGSNNDTIPDRVILGEAFVNMAREVQRWFETAKPYNVSHSLFPSYHNVSEIPFLRAANARMTALGCAYVICDSESEVTDSDDSDDGYYDYVIPNVSFVCLYGKPHINVSVPIYTNGTPCAACGGKDSTSCVWGSLCNNGVV
uniref:SCP domain-containing protein n=1 Tax=Angiostrongylus cantonensis TaxID=6313 RepID=A0A0K0DR74_ANGCA